MEIVLFWLVCAVAAGIVASGKGRSGVGWFFLSLLLFGVLGLLIVGFLPSVKDDPVRVSSSGPPTPSPYAATNAERRVPCPECREMIVEGARKCRFCGTALSETPSYAGPVPAHLRGDRS